jgi:hypothetical protein
MQLESLVDVELKVVYQPVRQNGYPILVALAGAYMYLPVVKINIFDP